MTLFVNGIADDEREFNFGERSKKGPARWGELHREWSLCKNGSM
jgi:carbonic anhydrase